jgi:hypothetical protein
MCGVLLADGLAKLRGSLLSIDSYWLEAALPDFGGLYLCLIRQPSKQNLAFNLYGRRGFDLFSKPSSQDFHLSISLKKINTAHSVAI